MPVMNVRRPVLMHTGPPPWCLSTAALLPSPSPATSNNNKTPPPAQPHSSPRLTSRSMSKYWVMSMSSSTSWLLTPLMLPLKSRTLCCSPDTMACGQWHKSQGAGGGGHRSGRKQQQ